MARNQKRGLMTLLGVGTLRAVSTLFNPEDTMDDVPSSLSLDGYDPNLDGHLPACNDGAGNHSGAAYVYTNKEVLESLFPPDPQKTDDADNFWMQAVEFNDAFMEAMGGFRQPCKFCGKEALECRCCK